MNIQKSSETLINFELEVDGKEVSALVVQFLIKLDDFSLSFPCQHTDDGDKEWRCNIPPLPFTKNGEYEYKIIVIMDNEHIFEPTNGEVSISDGIKISTNSVVVSGEIENTPLPSHDNRTVVETPKVSNNRTNRLAEKNKVILDIIQSTKIQKVREKSNKPKRKKITLMSMFD